jgi:hypothetical protein
MGTPANERSADKVSKTVAILPNVPFELIHYRQRKLTYFCSFLQKKKKG